MRMPGPPLSLRQASAQIHSHVFPSYATQVLTVNILAMMEPLQAAKE